MEEKTPELFSVIITKEERDYLKQLLQNTEDCKEKESMLRKLDLCSMFPTSDLTKTDMLDMMKLACELPKYVLLDINEVPEGETVDSVVDYFKTNKVLKVRSISNRQINTKIY